MGGFCRLQKSNQTVPVIQLTKVYTTTVRGKVVTPARAADPAKGNNITTARVWSSVDPANKVPVDSTDGSYTLEVANHTGSFTITADYTAADGKYTTSTAQTVNTTGAAVDNQDIALNYGYTTEVTVQVGLFPSGLGSTAGAMIASGATVVITAEDGHEVGRGTTSGASSPSAVITVNHPGRMRVTASYPGYRSAFQNRDTTEPDAGVNLNLAP